MQLLELKRQLERRQQQLQECQKLLEKRERNMEQILNLTSLIEKDQAHLFYLNHSCPEKAKILIQNLHESLAHIQTLKQSLRTIDHELDLLGDEEEYVVDELKRTLILKIQEVFPQAGKEYKVLETTLHSVQKKYDHSVNQKKLLLSFGKILAEGATVTLKVGWINFLFGQNPQALLARSIHAAAGEAEKIISSIHIETIHNFLEKFLREAQKKTNKDLYRGLFTKFHREFSELMHNLENIIEETKTEKINHQTTIDLWIEKYCHMGE
jgi:hypothetical protein